MPPGALLKLNFKATALDMLDDERFQHFQSADHVVESAKCCCYMAFLPLGVLSQKATSDCCCCCSHGDGYNVILTKQMKHSIRARVHVGL